MPRALGIALILLGLSACNSAGPAVTVPSTQPVTAPSSSASATTIPPTTVTPAPTATVSSNIFPNSDEQALLAHVPGSIAAACIRYTAAFGHPIAAVYCTPGHGVSRKSTQSTAVMYWTYDALQIMAWDESSSSDNLALYDFWLTAGPDA